MPSKTVRVFIYEDELRYLKWLVLQRPNIETGGDLFGLWRRDDSVVVQLVLGPGRNCSRTTISFHQDVQYLADVGQYMTTSQGLCNVGEWHSHHRIGLASPSSGDQDTVWHHMNSVAGGRFLVFIANITGSNNQPSVNVGSFMFIAATSEMRIGSFLVLPGSSPLRLSLNDEHLKPGTEPGVDWRSFGVAREEAGGTLSHTKPRNRSLLPKRPLKPGMNEINDNTARTNLLPRDKRAIRSQHYGTLNNKLNENGPLKPSFKESNHDTQRKFNECVIGKYQKGLTRHREVSDVDEEESSNNEKKNLIKTKQKVVTSQPERSTPLRDIASPITTEESISRDHHCCCCWCNFTSRSKRNCCCCSCTCDPSCRNLYVRAM